MYASSYPNYSLQAWIEGGSFILDPTRSDLPDIYIMRKQLGLVISVCFYASFLLQPNFNYYIIISSFYNDFTMMPIRDMFIQAARIQPHGIQGYHVQKKYVDVSDNHSKIKKSVLKRGSYLDDYNKVHGGIPGPGIYNYAKNLWPQKPATIKSKPSEKKTFIDQLMRQCKKQKRPAPGHYNLQKSIKQLEQQKKQASRRKTHHADRITYLDGIQYQATQTPGVGKYNTRQRPKSSTTYKKDKPEEWRKKHSEQGKKKPPKTPDMGSYNPKEVKSYERKPNKQGEWGKVKRFEDFKSGSGLGPGKYIPIDDWTHKNQVVNSRPRPKSAYYN